jgi:hypothetical protein
VIKGEPREGPLSPYDQLAAGSHHCVAPIILVDLEAGSAWRADLGPLMGRQHTYCGA